jgi:histidinol dehydrogenase
MKIVAEFNSNEELLSFISTFGTKTVSQVTKGVGTGAVKVEATKKEVKEDVKLTKPVQLHSPEKEDDKRDSTPKVDTEKAPIKEKETETSKEADSKDEESKITKEMVRAVFTKLIKANKQKEAKELTKKYGASKLPELKEENYAAVYKEAEGLL